MKASPKIKTRAHSANHHLGPAFHVSFQPRAGIYGALAVPGRSHVRDGTTRPFCNKRSTPETDAASRPRDARWQTRFVPEPSNCTNLHGAVVITQNPEDAQTASAGRLVLTNNENQNGGVVVGGNHSNRTDSHCGPNYTFIVEHFSQLLRDKTLVAKGQQHIAVIKPPFDFICSDGTKHDRRASDRRSHLFLFLLPSPRLLHQARSRALCRAATVRLFWAKVHGAATHRFFCIICVIDKAQLPQSRPTVRLIFCFFLILHVNEAVLHAKTESRLSKHACVVLCLLLLQCMHTPALHSSSHRCTS